MNISPLQSTVIVLIRMSLNNPNSKYFNIRCGLSWKDHYTTKVGAQLVSGTVLWWYETHPELFLEQVWKEKRKVARAIYNKFLAKIGNMGV